MVLAAGEGRRLLPFTKSIPKPLLEINGKALLEYHIERLLEAGISKIIINTSHMAEQIESFCMEKTLNSRWSADIHFSREPEPLETAGGIMKALPLLGNAPFIVVNADIYTEYPFERLVEREVPFGEAHLVLVANPEHNPAGDFALSGRGLCKRIEHLSTETELIQRDSNSFTFSGIAMYHPTFFCGYAEGKRPLRPVLDAGASAEKISGEVFLGEWADIGTPERWNTAKRVYADDKSPT